MHSKVRIDKYPNKGSTAIPRDMLPLDMLTPQIRHYELWQKNSRYANFSDLSTPSYAIFDFFQKNSRYTNLKGQLISKCLYEVIL